MKSKPKVLLLSLMFLGPLVAIGILAVHRFKTSPYSMPSDPLYHRHPGKEKMVATLKGETLDRSSELVSGDYEQYFFPFVPRAVVGGEEDLEQLISTRRFWKVLLEMKELSETEERNRCERLFFDAFAKHTNICYAMAKWVTDPSAPENHRSVLGTRMAMAAAMFVAADTGKLDVLEKQIDRLRKWRNEFEPIAKLPDRRFPSNYVSAVEDLVITPDYRFQVNVLRLAALRSGNLGALKEVDEACAAIHMKSNTLPMVRWDAQTTILEVLPDSPLDTSEGVTEYTFYDWSDTMTFNRIRFGNTWPADDEEKAFIEKLGSIVFQPR